MTAKEHLISFGFKEPIGEVNTTKSLDWDITAKLDGEFITIEVTNGTDTHSETVDSGTLNRISNTQGMEFPLTYLIGRLISYGTMGI